MPARRKQPERYRSLAHFFGARVRDLRDSYDERVGSPLRLAALAERTGYSPSMISAIERGEHLPDGGDRVRALDEALAADGELICLWPLVQRLGRHPIDELVAAADSGNNRNGIPQCQDDDMERRLLFRLTGLGLITAGPGLTSAESVRQQLERAIGTAESSTVEDWEAACVAHRQAVNTRPPAQVRDQLVADLAALQWSLTQARPEHKTDLQRCVAWMSTLHAGILTCLGEVGQARRWWATARHAADASGDLDMRVRVRGKEAVMGFFSFRGPESVITLSREAREMAGGLASTSVLQALGGEAEALALMGRDAEAREVLGRFFALADKVGERSELGWTPDTTWCVASWVHSYGGSAKAADKAREEALRRLPNYHNDTGVRLHQGIALARGGGYAEALRLTAEIISGLAPAYRSQIILHVARQVQEIIPPAQRKGSAFDDYRSVVMSPPLQSA
ncbi:helix-turn-helix transcriptional regulator [Thermopolyspora sp. NPDC052614]|uniref:helix-turn-helix domain-containing protein n=1 Tax=Thermopolyspora sp. NPDC052614 TaxID=3155682 RepID=UPI003415D04D